MVPCFLRETRFASFNTIRLLKVATILLVTAFPVLRSEGDNELILSVLEAAVPVVKDQSNAVVPFLSLSLKANAGTDIVYPVL
ncbi:hypothetical protein D3C76_1746120 [compost metagenome]